MSTAQLLCRSVVIDFVFLFVPRKQTLYVCVLYSPDVCTGQVITMWLITVHMGIVVVVFVEDELWSPVRMYRLNRGLVERVLPFLPFILLSLS